MRQELNAALKAAMKEKKQKRVSTVRLILAAIKERDIAERGNGDDEGIGDQDILALLQKMVKQREESVAMYTEAGRMEQAEGEAAEIEIISEFLPSAMSDDEIETAVSESIDSVGASSLKDMGSVMAKLREEYPGRMDFSKVGPKVKALLSAK